MKKWFKRLLERYKMIPRQLMSQSVKERSRAQRLITITICLLLMIVCAAYMLSWHFTRKEIEEDNATYSALYDPGNAPASAAPTVSPTATPPRTATPSPSPAASPTPAPTATEETTQKPAASLPEFEIAVDATLLPRTTPDADTIVYALETPPPVQESFAELLALNPETIGFISVGDRISLPVVQRKNDNSYYLNHSFEGEESPAGTLFLDGSNLLVPEDKNLIIYGHNMKNGTMFQPLIHYEDLSFLKEHALVRFDTIYENRTYIPFAAFTATVEPGSDYYLDIRQFLFDESSFNAYIRDIERLSLYKSPVEVVYGDNVLLLVTCEYIHDNGRFIVALREMRPDETEIQMTELVKYTKLK